MSASARPANRHYGYDDLPELLTRMSGDEKHSASATSTLDLVWVAFDRVLRIDPSQPDDPNRDRFLLSKGHGPMAYYAVLAAKRFFDPEVLDSFGRFDSMLGGHPDRNLVPGVEIASGSLGHGLAIAVGVAMALRIRKAQKPRVFCLLGDAELDEGSNFEAVQYAARARLDTLTTIVVDNRSDSMGWPGGIASRFAVEGWETIDVDGHDHDAIEAALSGLSAGAPRAVVAAVESDD